MASTINAITTGAGGIVTTGDSSGIVAIQSNGTTILTTNSTGALGVGSSPSYGTSGQVLTSSGSSAAPTWSSSLASYSLYYALNSGYAGSNATGAQSVFGVGVTLEASTIYEFESVIALGKSAGTTSHTIALGFGGTATIIRNVR